ncbi:MAG: helix-turn-helix transcriptional regulator [Chlorobia bacterium]|nr:helix-turn-helix transcriptional regulator [Fimbriimonadaceae bacterium]
MRLRMFHHFTEGKRSEAEIAQLIGVAPRSLYYHIRILLDVGLIQQVGVRHVAKKPQAIYEATSGRILLDSKQAGAQSRKAIAQNIKSVLRIAAREVEAALSSEEAGASDWGSMTRQRLCLTEESAVAFRVALDALTDAYSKQVEGGKTVCFTAVLAPRLGKNR